MDLIYYFMPTIWKNKSHSNVKEMTDFFETRVENVEPEKHKNKYSTESKKKKDKKSFKKRKREYSDSSAVESSKEFSVEHSPIKKYFITSTLRITERICKLY